MYLVFIYKGHVSELMTIIESIYREQEVGEIDTLPEDDRVREPLNVTFDNPGIRTCGIATPLKPIQLLLYLA